MHESENKDLSFCNYWTNSASKRKGKKYKARGTVSSHADADDLFIDTWALICMNLFVTY
jgi:hypothetical protein